MSRAYKTYPPILAFLNSIHPVYPAQTGPSRHFHRDLVQFGAISSVRRYPTWALHSASVTPTPQT